MGGGSLAVLALTAGPGLWAQGAPVYKDAAAPIPLRVADLMARMTLEEKVAQIRTAWAAKADMIDGLDFEIGRAHV